jgi:DNA-binding NtrC family response regulator
VNCVAIPTELAESILFGHVKGAFTGATADRMGHFELADGGTLFLDEVGDMPMEIQGKLLRVLEDGQITPVGGTSPRTVDIRLVCATNVDLPAKIAGGDFRQDLYFRLARFLVETPPLRERPEDIPLLAAHFLDVFSAEMGRSAPPLTDAAIAVLTAHDYPGNVRELKNIVERALILGAGKPIGPEHLQWLPRPGAAAPGEAPRPQDPAQGPAQGPGEALPWNLEKMEQVMMERALAHTRGNVAEAARLLGVNRSRLYRRFSKGEGT